MKFVERTVACFSALDPDNFHMLKYGMFSKLMIEFLKLTEYFNVLALTSVLSEGWNSPNVPCLIILI